MRKACVLSNGCPESLADSARIKLCLEKNNWQIVNHQRDADLTVFYSCALTNAMVNNSLDTVKELQKKTKPGSQVIVWGCLPKVEPETLKPIYDGPTFSVSNIEKFNEIIQAVTPIDGITANELCSRYQKNSGWKKILTSPLCFYKIPSRLLYWFYYDFFKKTEYSGGVDSATYYITVSTGCLGHCTYCSVRNSRGTIKSKGLDKVIGEFREGLSLGYKNFVLLGTDVGSYGRDLGHTLTDLLGEMIKEKGDYRIGLRNLNPFFLNQMLDDLQIIFATGKIWFTLIPIESGSDRIIKLMGRNYAIATIKESIQKLKQACPDVIIRTQVMVGFPTETKQDFLSSMRILDELKFDYVEVYRFSPRSHTLAQEMSGKIPYRVALLREYRMKCKVALAAIRTMCWGKKPHLEKTKDFKLSTMARET